MQHNRRDFMKSAAAVGAAGYAMNATAKSYGAIAGANDRIGVAFLGVGGRCQQHIDVILDLQKAGATSVLVTHDMSSIFAVTDRVAFLKAGRIRALGTADEIEASTDPDLKGFIHGETM